MSELTGRIHSLESFGTVDGPGIRYVVFFQGCPMRCLYCHNPDTWEMAGGTQMTADEIIEKITRNREFYTSGGITATGGEPMLQIDFLTELFAKAKQNGIHTALHPVRSRPYRKSRKADGRYRPGAPRYQAYV